MTFVAFLVLVIIFSYLGDEKISGSVRAVFFRIALIFTLSYMTGMGGDLFTDHQEYQMMFKNIDKFRIGEISGLDSIFLEKSDSGGVRAEIGFLCLCKLLSLLGLSDIGIFFALAIITNTLIVITYYRFKWPPFIFLLFICNGTFIQEANLVRQMLAVSIFAFSLKYIECRNLLKYSLCCLIAFAIHRSSMVMLPFFLFFLKFDDDRYIKLVLAGMWLFSVLVGLRLLSFNIDLFLAISLVSDTYGGFMTDDPNMGIEKASFSLIYNFFVALSFFFYKKESYKIYFYVFILNGIFQNISVQFLNLNRVAYYFEVISPAFIPFLIEHISKHKKIVPIMEVLSLFMIFFYIRLYIISVETIYLGPNFHQIFEIFR